MIGYLRKLRLNLVIFLFRLIPLKGNKIIFFSNLGNAYTCNPKYLCEYIAQKYPNDFDLVWVFNSESAIKHTLPKECRFVNFFSISYLYEILTAKYIISNARIPRYFMFKKRKKQIYIQTWHSSLRLKKIEKDVEEQLEEEYIKNAILDSKKIDYIISGCQISSETFRNSFWYDGKILNIGTPRIDYLIKNKNDLLLKKEICEKYSLDMKKNYILYAPTFRKNNDLSAYDINFDELVQTIKNKFSGEWQVLYKLHPNLINLSNDILMSKSCINATLFDDIQELLILSEILITDYSSCMFDAMYMRKKCFLYLNDLDLYLQNNRTLYFNIDDLPFSKSKNQTDLLTSIMEFDEEKYLNDISKFLSCIGSYENGKSCEQVLKIIFDKGVNYEN